MKLRPLLLLALLMGLSAAASAKDETAQSDTTNRRTSVKKQVSEPPMKPIDLSTLVPKDSAKVVDDSRPDDRYNAQGVNCSLYPARCG